MVPIVQIIYAINIYFLADGDLIIEWLDDDRLSKLDSQAFFPSYLTVLMY